jgi:hypothetical protein
MSGHGVKDMSLESEIKQSALHLATDAYDMSVGEIMNVYRDGELIVNPEFQRLFRWNIFQKSHLIESLLIGVPIPSIFVFETEDGSWELIDGLQRVSTILEFAGLLRDSDGKLVPPSVLCDTRYLPSLDGKSWDGTPPKSKPIGPSFQVAIKRSRLAVQILKKTSDEKAKYDLFQRLNSHGSIATPQELRNSVIYMINKEYFKILKDLSEDQDFINIMHQSERSSESQSKMDFLTRFLVFNFMEYDRSWDIEEYLDNGIIEVISSGKKEFDGMVKQFKETLKLLVSTGNVDLLRRFKDGKFQGRVGQAAFETVFLGVSQNLRSIRARANPGDYVLKRAKALWARADVQEFTKAGQRGTDRIQKTIPFGKAWFAK